MSVKKVSHDVVSKTGSYKDSEGNNKNRYINIGILMEEDGKPSSIKLNALPIPDSNGEIWLNLFEKKEAEE